MISTTMMRWWLCAVLCSRSIASVAMPSAVSKPNVTSVSATSLSIVLGRVMTLRPVLHQVKGVLLRAAAAEADQHVEVMLVVVLDDDVGHVHGLAADRHAVRLVAAGAEDRAADRQDAGQLALGERSRCGSPSGRESRRGSRSRACRRRRSRPCRRRGSPRSGRGCRRRRSGCRSSSPCRSIPIAGRDVRRRLGPKHIVKAGISPPTMRRF